jgi:SAM-dependent methyltransferase
LRDGDRVEQDERPFVTAEFAGRYPIEMRTGEIERLLVQGAVMAEQTRTMLDAIGVKTGWACLDIGCGPRGVTDLFSERVGASGRVVGLDMNDAFLAYGRDGAPANVEFCRGDAYGSDLPPDSFDLVHLRFVASTAGDIDRLLREAIRLVRPGGFLALQEPDGETLHCYPAHPAYECLKGALLGAFKGVGAGLDGAASFYGLLRKAGLVDVAFRPFLLGFQATDPMADYLPATVESLRSTILGLGLVSESELDRALADCRLHLHDPETVSTLYTVVQTWGRKPSGP